MSLMKGRKGNNMKYRIFVLFFLTLVLADSIYAGDKFSLHIACSQGKECIELAGDNGKKESIQATPAMELTKADIAAASVQSAGIGRFSLNIELSKEASGKFEKITGENIGKKLMVVFDNKILTAPTINMPISERKILISNSYGDNAAFWKNSLWLEDLIKASNSASGHSIRLYTVVAFGIAIVAFVFVLLPRLKQMRASNPE
jgi:hypothetical protein